MKKQVLSGAEVLALILQKEKIKTVFAYPGTSELAMCDAILNKKGIMLMNGRGDKESAFMAAGGSMLRATRTVAILHGARGLTNAAGAIADAFRNEIGTVYIVGLPSRNSSKFLPPHGEKNLISSIGNFTKCFDEVTNITSKNDKPEDVKIKAIDFIHKIQKAIFQSRCLPLGPTILGIPQDATEKYWIPRELMEHYTQNENEVVNLDKTNIGKAVHLIKCKKNPIIFVDDFFYKNPDAKKHLFQFAKSLQAPIFQVYYSRGPMLFETILDKGNPYFFGQYKPQNTLHKNTMQSADLIITLEDRNMYSRVVGELPSCDKIAITSNPKLTQKNAYLKDEDILLTGKTTAYMGEIVRQMHKKEKLKTTQYFKVKQSKFIQSNGQSETESILRKGIVATLSTFLHALKRPVLVDDSQMFGGMLAEYYQLFPAKLRVFGDHGAFIGGGLAYANGLAQSETQVQVVCTLGDQSFTNAIQGLICAVQEQLHITYIVCNNGKSVSLTKQIQHQDKNAFQQGKSNFLFNAPFDYSALAKSLTIQTYTLDLGNLNKKNALLKNKQLRNVLQKAILVHGPVFIELKLPSDQNFWKGIWAIKGNE